MTIDWKAVAPELERKLDPKHVKKGGGQWGPKGDYLEGWFAIQEANRIFGHGGWSYTIDLRQDDLREVTTPKGPQWQAAYTCICTVTVGEVVRQDVGFGSGFAKGIGDAIEGATKESATDALKRCLRTFGNPFGLALYDKTRENVGVDAPPRHEPKLSDLAKPEPPPSTPSATFDRMMEALGKVRSRKALNGLLTNRNFEESAAYLQHAMPDLWAQISEEIDRITLAYPGEAVVPFPPAIAEAVGEKTFDEVYSEGRRA